MPAFTVNPHRKDPYKGFKFRVTWDGRVVPAVSWVSALVRDTVVTDVRDGNERSLVRRTPGLTSYEPVTLRRGITFDHSFEDWAEQVWSSDAAVGSEVALRDFRKDVTIELLDEAGQLVKRYLVHRAWPSTYEALPVLDASESSIALETLVLQHEGWERDKTVAEPAEH
jgi:phage tail-like protein